MTPTDDDLTQVLQAVRSQFINYAVDGGAVNNLSVAFDPPLSFYPVGLPIRVLVYFTNTGPATIDAGAGRVPIKHTDGLPTAAGELPAGGVVNLVYDGTAFQMVNFFGMGGTGGGPPPTISFATIPYCVDNSTTPNIINALFSPAITTLTAGTAILVKIANTNTGSCSINVNGILNIPMRANGHGLLGAGDLAAGDVKLMTYDGTYFWLDALQQFIISTEITYKVHGTGADFPDLISAFAYLGKYRITPTGHVILQLAGATSGQAQKFTYTQSVIIDHPNNDRISIFGAPILISPPLNDGGYSSTGPSLAQRNSDNALNLATLRNCFATELNFAGQGLAIYGTTLQHLDAILFTGSGIGLAGGWGSNASAGSGVQFYASGYLNNVPKSLANPNAWAYSGLAAVGFSTGFGFDVGSCVSLQGQAWSQSGTAPLICVGCNTGLSITNGGYLTTPGNVICLSNNVNGLYLGARAGDQLDGGVFCCSNGQTGYNAYCSATSFVATPIGGAGGPSHFWKNGSYGAAFKLSFGTFGVDFGTGANANTSGSVYAIDGSHVQVWSDLGLSGHCSPALGTQGNNFSSISLG